MNNWKQQLESRWWHRLAKVIFTILSIFILITSAFIFYSLEEQNARQYKIARSFSEFLQQEKEIADRGCSPEEKAKGFNFACYGGRLLAPESFISQNDLKDHSLGCLQGSGKVEWLSEYSFKEGVVCDQKTGITCTVPKNICDGNSSNIVKYDYEIKYGFSNYFSIFLKTIGVLIGWALFAYIVYYKGLLYIVFGGKKGDDN